MIRFYTLILCLLSSGANAQHWGSNYISFDPSDTFGLDYHQYIFVDSTYTYNTWQVGAPHKTVFTSAWPARNAIITDTVGHYPANDTSVFILKFPGYLTTEFGAFSQLRFWYQLDIDSGDIARVEMSLDSGISWLNLLDSLPPSFYWTSGTPVLTRSTTGWNQFTLLWGRDNVAPDSTMYFRFTFISDSSDSIKDGWMIDNLELDYSSESVPKLQNPNLISVYPNPSKGNIYIHTTKQYADAKLTVYNTLGQEVYHTESPPQNGYLNLPLSSGTYTLKYFGGDEYCVKRIVIDR